MKGFWRFLGVAGLCLFLGQPAQAQVGPPEFPLGVLTIDKADGTSELFDIEIATSPEQITYGLMFRRSMPHDNGMIFIFDPPQPVKFWMKNTFISLDMLFAKPDGEIVKIIPNTVPESTSIMDSDYTVNQVLELNAGEAAKRGIKLGDKISFKAKS